MKNPRQIQKKEHTQQKLINVDLPEQANIVDFTEAPRRS